MIIALLHNFTTLLITIFCWSCVLWKIYIFDYLHIFFFLHNWIKRKHIIYTAFTCTEYVHLNTRIGELSKYSRKYFEKKCWIFWKKIYFRKLVVSQSNVCVTNVSCFYAVCCSDCQPFYNQLILIMYSCTSDVSCKSDVQLCIRYTAVHLM